MLPGIWILLLPSSAVVMAMILISLRYYHRESSSKRPPHFNDSGSPKEEARDTGNTAANRLPLNTLHQKCFHVMACVLPNAYDISMLSNTCKDMHALLRESLQKEKNAIQTNMATIANTIRDGVRQSLPFVISDIFDRYNRSLFPLHIFKTVHSVIYYGRQASIAITATVMEIDIAHRTPTATIAMHVTPHHTADGRLTAGAPLTIRLAVVGMGKNRFLANTPMRFTDGHVRWRESRFTLQCASKPDDEWETVAADREWEGIQRAMEAKIHSTMDGLFEYATPEMCSELAD